MRRICAWCKKDLDVSLDDSRPDNYITHGMCPVCSDKVLREIGIDLNIYLDRLPAPVVLVDSMGVVKQANAEARNMFKKDLGEIIDKPGGDVFECVNARLPEGCGNTIHCSGCTIRRTIMETHETGKGFCRVPAYLNQNSGDSAKRVDFYISTEKVAKLVFLRIDEVDGRNPLQDYTILTE